MHKSNKLTQDAQAYVTEFYEILNSMIYGMTHDELNRSISHNFIRQMIPHHLGAIQMSKNALRFPICAELLPILHEIIVSQERGVQEMKTLLAEISTQ